MPNSMFDLLNNERLWTCLKFGSFIIGVSCFVFGTNWKDNPAWLNILVLSGCICAIFKFYAPLLTLFSKPLTNLSVIMYAVLFLCVAFFPYWYDQHDEEGKPEMGYEKILGLISSGALTLTSLILLRQVALELNLRPKFWRLLGFGSSIVGFSCCALSPTFNYMIGEWNWWKIAIYITVSSVYPCILLFVEELRSRNNFILKANVCFLVFLGSCVYSYYQDRIEAGKNESDNGRMLSMFSLGGFALMSLSLSRLANIGFEMGVSAFFLSGFLTCAIKTNLRVATAIAVICYVIFHIRSSSDSMSEMQGGDTEHAILEIDSLSQFDTGSIPENFRSDLDSQMELSDVVDHGNQRTEADNPQVDYSLSSHVKTG